MNFLLNVNLVLLTQVAVYSLAFALRVMIARALGAEGQGEYSLFLLVVSVASSVATLGMSLGNVYFIGKGKHPLRVLLANSHLLVLAVAVVASAVVLAVGLGLEPRAFVSGNAFWLYALAVPALMEFVLLTALLQGSSRFLALNIAVFARGFIVVPAAAVLWAGGWLTIFSLLAAWVGSYILADIVALGAIGVRNWLARPRWAVVREQIGFGAPGQVATIVQFLNYRLDQFLVVAFLTTAAVGYYAVAVGVGESVWWIGNSVVTVLLPRLTGMKAEEAAELTPLMCRNTMLVSLAAAVVLALASPLAIELAFGEEFSPAVAPLLWLMPGVVALSGAKILSSYIFSQGRVILNTYVAGISLAVTLLLDLLLIPRFGISGAAIASSLAYGTAFVLTLYWYRRLSGNNVWEAVIPRGSDARLYLDVARRLGGPVFGGPVGKGYG